MAVQKISENAAFAQGAQLWIVPDPAHSPWSRKIDWYLNFQMARAQSHHPPELMPGLIELLDEEGLASPTLVSAPKAPLLVASQHRLPAVYTVSIPYEGSPKSWVQAALKVWQNLGRPGLRVFAPQGIKGKQLIEEWPKSEGSGEIGVVGEWN